VQASIATVRQLLGSPSLKRSLSNATRHGYNLGCFAKLHWESALKRTKSTIARNRSLCETASICEALRNRDKAQVSLYCAVRPPAAILFRSLLRLIKGSASYSIKFDALKPLKPIPCLHLWLTTCRNASPAGGAPPVEYQAGAQRRSCRYC
jgi:hypothetical protein